MKKVPYLLSSQTYRMLLEETMQQQRKHDFALALQTENLLTFVVFELISRNMGLCCFTNHHILFRFYSGVLVTGECATLHLKPDVFLCVTFASASLQSCS